MCWVGRAEGVVSCARLGGKENGFMRFEKFSCENCYALPE